MKSLSTTFAIFLISSITIIASLLFTTTHHHHQVLALTAVPSFELNLDLPFEQRWAPPGKPSAVDVIVAARGWDHSFAPVLDLYLPITWIIPKEVIATFNSIMKTRYPQYYGELQGIYQSLVKAGGIDKLASPEQYTAIAFAYEILHLNILPRSEHQHLDVTRRRIAMYIESKAREYIRKYEGREPSPTEDASLVFKKACTGILALPVDQTQDILHGRNMDEQPAPARNLTLKITATSGGKMVYQALDWLWFSSGVETSQREGGVTMELNYRNFFQNSQKDKFSFTEMVDRLSLNTSVPVLLFHRIVHEAKMDFDSMIHFSTNVATFAAPFYAITSGTKRRGAVLTLHFNQSLTYVARINDTYVYPESDGLPWALVQTNYDILNGQPDNMNDPRRNVAQNTLRMLGQKRGASDLGLWQTLSVFPVHNPSTFYTALLSVAEGKEIEGFIRRSMKPDPQIPL